MSVHSLLRNRGVNHSHAVIFRKPATLRTENETIIATDRRIGRPTGVISTSTGNTSKVSPVLARHRCDMGLPTAVGTAVWLRASGESACMALSRTNPSCAIFRKVPVHFGEGNRPTTNRSAICRIYITVETHGQNPVFLASPLIKQYLSQVLYVLRHREQWQGASPRLTGGPGVSPENLDLK